MAVANTSYRVHVSGLARTPVRSYDGGIVEEDNLGYFFWDRGCKVDAVRLMVDQSSGKCRGFGFVDLADEKSFRDALGFDGETDLKDVQLDALHSNGIIIKVAKPSEDAVRTKRQELQRVQDQTEEMERAFRLREARVRELEREVKTTMERQKALEAERCLEAQLAEQRARQDEIRKEGEKLAAAERYYAAVLRNEQCRTKALETLVADVDAEHHKPPTPTEAVEESVAKAADGKDTDESSDTLAPTTSVGQPEWRVKNTFIEYYLPVQPKSSLARTQTAPPTYAASGEPKSMDDSAPHASSPLPPAPLPPAPWTLQRESSVILRSILEDKIEAEADRSDGVHPEVRAGLAKGSRFSPPERGAPRSPRAAEAQPRSTEEAGSGSKPSGAKAESAKAAGEKEGPRCVRIRNLPLVEARDLQEFLHEELSRLWSSARARPPPAIEDIEIADVSPIDEMTYAQKAMGTEARVTFVNPDDAAWLVDGRRPRNWSSTETLSVLGRVLSAEWPPAPPLADWRRLRYKADTDASSNISYNTVGTRQSFSSTVAKQTVARSEGNRGEGVENPAANRTVILQGIATDLPKHMVRQEVLDLLKRLWQRDGLKFDPTNMLHRGADGGVDVRAARRSGEENGGTCVIKLRNYADAKWLVEQARGLSIEGRPCRASWAKPRKV